MNIHYVTCSHPFNDDYGDADVPSMQDHNDHTNWLTAHNDRLDEQWRVLECHGRLIDEDRKNIHGTSEWIRGVEEQVRKMPQTLRETLDQLLKEMLSDKLEMGVQVVEGLKKDVDDLRKEREKVSAQLTELKQQREGMKAELEQMRNYCEDAKKTHEELLKKLEGRLKDVEDVEHKMKDDFSMQVTEFKRSVPVPKKFAQFLFVQPGTSIEKKG